MGCIMTLFRKTTENDFQSNTNVNMNTQHTEVIMFLEKLREKSTLIMIHRPSQREYRKLTLIERLLVFYKEEMTDK